MNALFLIVALAVVTKSVTADTCTECISKYTTAKNAAGTNNTIKCAATKAAAICLTAASEEGCASGDKTAKAQLKTGGTVFNDAGGASCNTTVVCTCQGAYYTAVANRDTNTTTATKCSEAKTYRSCVAAATTTLTACDETTKQADQLKTIDDKIVPDDCNSARGIVLSITAMCLSLIVSLFKF